jgi:ATP-dependent 26S proteasome regulatory subunit
LTKLDAPSVARYQILFEQSSAIQNSSDASAAEELHGYGLNQLLWTFLQLLASRGKITWMLRTVSEEKLAKEILELEKKICQVPVPILAEKLIGMNRVNIKSFFLRALRNNVTISVNYLTKIKKESIEKDAMGKLEYLETSRSLDHVAGHVEARKWLREDSDLIRRGITNAIPMGYLFTGRIGTGKTFLVQCFAGECGIPFVELKNFRDKWIGTAEENLEKVFTILHALGQVVVFVDEADQATGRRGGGDESGVSDRIYAMLAKEMANTDNRWENHLDFRNKPSRFDRG